MTNGPKLVFDEELKHLAAERGPASAEAFVLLELREARSKGEKVFAFRIPPGRYDVETLPAAENKRHGRSSISRSMASRAERRGTSRNEQR